MGRMIYEDVVRAEFDDRLLAHLQIVIGNKLRRDESFYFSWRDGASEGHGRTSIWVHPGATLVFKFLGARSASINPAWLELLMRAANAPAGLYIVPEPEETEHSPQGARRRTDAD